MVLAVPVLIVLGLAWWGTGALTEQAFTGPMWEALHQVLGVLWPAAGAVAALGIVERVVGARRCNKKLDAVAADWERMVRAADLDGGCASLLTRACTARRAILGSLAYQQGELDRRLVDAEFTERVWHLAEMLRDYSRLTQAPHGQPPDSRAAAQRKNRRRGLAPAWDAAQQRVRELEDYAARVAALDTALVDAADKEREQRQMEELAAGEEQVRDVLARAAGESHLRQALADPLDAATSPMRRRPAGGTGHTR